MKKTLLCFIGTMLLLSACTPTKVPESSVPTESIEVPMTTGSAADKLPDPNAPVLQNISIYVPDGEKLKKEMDGVETVDSTALIEKLAEYGVLEKDTQVLSYEEEGQGFIEVGPGVSAAETKSSSTPKTGTLDLSKMPEQAGKKDLMITAVANTFIENFGLDHFVLKVEGLNYFDGEYLEYKEDFSK